MLEAMRKAALTWYIVDNSLSSAVAPAFQEINARIGIPLVSALLLGVPDAAASCQLTQTIGMLSIFSRPSVGYLRWQNAFAYLAGKALVYSALGLLAVPIGAGLSAVSITAFVSARKVIGPLLFVAGLSMAGVLRFGWLSFTGVAARLRAFVARSPQKATSLLGNAFGFAFLLDAVCALRGAHASACPLPSGGRALPGALRAGDSPADRGPARASLVRSNGAPEARPHDGADATDRQRGGRAPGGARRAQRHDCLLVALAEPTRGERARRVQARAAPPWV